MSFRPILFLLCTAAIAGACTPLGMSPVAPTNGVVPSPGPTVAGTPPTAPPWFAPGADALKHVEDAGIDVHATEQLDYHLHSYVTVYWNGAQVPVPANLGIADSGIWISPLHTHDTSGKIHVEAPKRLNLTVKQLFQTWNVSLGGATVYENGKPVADGPGLVFQDGQVVSVVYGTPPSLIPNKYPFSDGGQGVVGQAMPSAAPSTTPSSAPQ